MHDDVPPPALTDLVPDPTALERIADGCTWTEGPCWIPSSRTLRWSDIPGDRIMQWHADDGRVTPYAEAVEFTNGRIADRDGSVLQCSHGRRRVERDRDGIVEAVVSEWQGRPLNSPNDLVVARDGAIWFTDPSYGITQPAEGHPGEREYDDHWVFRYDPVGQVLAPAVTDVEFPNGLAFSPDESVLYVASSSGELPVVRAYDMDGHRAKNGRVFAALEPGEGGPDGIRVDEHGNLWSSSHVGIVVWSPSGERIGVVPVPEIVSNLCFGGEDGSDLFVTASTSVYRIRTATRDAALG